MDECMEKSMFPDDTELLDLCARKGAELELRDGRLYVRANTLTQEELLHLRRHKFSLVRTLRRKHSARELAASWAEWQGNPGASAIHEAPLTPYQEIFALLTSQGEHAIVNQVGVFELALPVADPGGRLVQEALRSLMTRHPMLRARVVRKNEKGNGILFHNFSQSLSVLEIAPSCPLPVTIFQPERGSDREADIEACRKAFRTSGYDLARAPLWRAAIFPHPQHRRSTLVLGLHHIIMDGWSMGLLASDLAHLLDCLSGKETEDTLPPVTYPSFAAWLAQKGLSHIKSHQLAFWTDLVQSVPQCHRIRSDYVRGTMPKETGHGLCRVRISAQVKEKVQRFAAARGCSLFAALHTALRLLLYRVCGQTHAPILTVAANRQLPGLERVVGCFVNVLPLVCPFNPHASMTENMRQSQDCLVQALDHQMLPFQDIVAAAQVKRQKARHPLSQIFLTLQNAFASGVHSAVTARLPEDPISAYDLAFVLWDYGEEGIVAHLEYDASLYREEHAQALLHAYVDCLCDLLLADSQGKPENIANCRDSSPQKDVPLAQKLGQCLDLARYAAVILRDAGPFTDLVAKACDLCGCPCLTPEQARATAFANPVLWVQTRWPEEPGEMSGSADVLLVNHLPTAQQLARVHAGEGACLSMLLQLGSGSSLVVARAQDLVSDRMTYIAASTELLPTPVTQKAFMPVQDGPARGLTSLGQGLVALPLPGGSSPLLWRHGHAVHLDQVMRDLAQMQGQAQPDCALGLLVPAHSSLLSSVVHEEGEMVAWVGRGLVHTDLLESLPEALQPRHIMHIDHVPRRSDGTVCRKSLLDIPFYSPEFVRRALPNASLETLQDREADTLLHVPAQDLRGMTALRLPKQETSRENTVFVSGKECLVLLSGSSLDNRCLSLFLRHEGCRFLLKGINAIRLCAELGSVRTCPWTENGASGPIGSVVRIIADVAACPQAPELPEGVPCLNLLVADTCSKKHLADRARVFASLCQAAMRANLRSPHTFLVFALPDWKTGPGREKAQDALTETRAFTLLHRALASGRDMGIIGLEPEDMGWQSLLLRTPHPQYELVTQGQIEPHLLPHPLRNAFCETGPLRMETGGTCARNRDGSAEAGSGAACGDIAPTMARIWNSILQTENADPNANFFDLGGTSVMAPLIQERIASSFQVDIGVAGVFLYPSLQELTMVVSSSLESRTNARKSRTEENFQARQHAARAARNNRKQVRRSHEATLA